MNINPIDLKNYFLGVSQQISHTQMSLLRICQWIGNWNNSSDSQDQSTRNIRKSVVSLEFLFQLFIFGWGSLSDKKG